jgi:1-acyl-sn-glycerol-3-phosphate acyltransferase
VGNHSGQLPFDGLMVAASLFLELEPPRIVRSMVERWVPRLPWISTLFARAGQVVGTPDNCRRLLERGNVVLVFPEGVRGIGKTWERRYQLQRFGTGFMRLALATKSPILPVAVVGAEEQAPAFANVAPLAQLLGVPSFPITPTFPLFGLFGLLPLPTKYRLVFGPALRFEGGGDEDEGVIEAHVEVVRSSIAAQLERGLAAREGVFR